MKNAIILHGMPSREEYLDPETTSPSNSHWIPWIQKQLLIKGYSAQTPELPDPFNPQYEAWKRVFELFPITTETVLIGHSCGAGFLVRWLSENKETVGKVILVAPWIDTSKELENGFFDFDIDTEMGSRAESITILVSQDDHEEILSSVERLKDIKNISIERLEGMGHFTSEDMSSNEFPALLELL